MPAEAVLKFLTSVGPGSEAELYLRLFRARPAERFATLVIEREVIEQNAEQVALDVRFLGELGLFPSLVVGLEDSDSSAASRVCDALEREGVAFEHLETGDPVDALTAATARGAVPVWTVPGTTHLERMEALARTLTGLGSDKLVFIRSQGGIRLRGHRLSVVNLQTDCDTLAVEPEIDAETRGLVADCQRLVLELVPHRILVAFTSPLELLRELFTVKGAGTLLRKGARIERHHGYEGVDVPRLCALLESSFGKPVSPRFLARPIHHAYIEEAYRGAALIMQTELGGYLSKFSVTRQAQGEGIGHDLWNAMTADYAALYWRARTENPIRAWYERQCQGRFAAGDWTIYFRGLRPEDVPLAVTRALAEPLDF